MLLTLGSVVRHLGAARIGDTIKVLGKVPSLDPRLREFVRARRDSGSRPRVDPTG